MTDQAVSTESAEGVITASAEQSDASVMQADFEESEEVFEPGVGESTSVAGVKVVRRKSGNANAARSGAVKRAAGAAHQAQPNYPQAPPQDRWSGWQAMEITSKGVTFPGLARMFGYPTPQSATPAPNVNQNTRSRSAAVASAPNAMNHQPHVASKNEAIPTPRTNRGWRDPRELREQRLAAKDNHAGSEAKQNIPSAVTPEWSDHEVGTGVMMAAALQSTDSGASGTTTAAWYGIHQAPTDNSIETMQLSSTDLSDLQLKLSEMVAGPERTWNLAPLADRARYFVEHGATPIERGEARLLVERIDAFAELQRRSMQAFAPDEFSAAGTASGVVPASWSGGASGAGSLQNSSAAKLAAPFGLQIGLPSPTFGSGSPAPRYDATGWLVPVHSQGRDLPTHALTNDAGQAIVYLTPAAGVNLSRYQGQAVGVYGLRGYLPQLKSNHIQVQRVSRLQ